MEEMVLSLGIQGSTHRNAGQGLLSQHMARETVMMERQADGGAESVTLFAREEGR